LTPSSCPLLADFLPSLPSFCSAAAVEAATTSNPTKRVDGLQTPHGDKLVSLMVPEAQRQAVIDSCSKTLECSDRNACDVELLCVG
jgi:sulfate adenylyltransferase